MKKILLLLLTFLVLGSCDQDSEIIDANAMKNDTAVEICHYNPANQSWKTIFVNENQVQKHLDHGDQLGTCGLTYVPDDGFEQQLIDLGYDDVLDNYVLTSNISDVTELRIVGGAYDPSISDMTGIENFKSLEIFKFSENEELTMMNLSFNTNLIELELLEDYALTTLLLSNNPNLEKIRLISVYGLLELNTDSCKNLREMVFSETDIQTLDLTKNKELEIIGFHEANHLAELDLSQNKKLKRFSTTHTSYAMTVLDLSSNPMLEYVRVADADNLIELNLKNHHNTNIPGADFMHLNSLTCIQVDDADYANANWSILSSPAVFSEDCGY